MRLVVMVSGSGTNLQAILDAIAEGSLHAEVVAVVSNRRAAYALERAAAVGISTAYAPLRPYIREGRTRREYDEELGFMVRQFEPDCVVCAGWMHIFTDAFIEQFPGKLINLHPALPGQFPGRDGIGDAFAAFQRGEIDHTGVMVHEVVAAVDAGPVLDTVKVPILAEDDRESLEQRIHQAEYELLVGTLRMLSERHADDTRRTS